MNWIEGFFVRAKHWQIFLLFVVVFAVEEIPVIVNLTMAVNSQEGSAVILFFDPSCHGSVRVVWSSVAMGSGLFR